MLPFLVCSQLEDRVIERSAPALKLRALPSVRLSTRESGISSPTFSPLLKKHCFLLRQSPPISLCAQMFCSFITILFQIVLINTANLPEYLNTDTFYYNYGGKCCCLCRNKILNLFQTTGNPETQFKRFPECFNRQRQSPIDINEPIQLDPDAIIILSESWYTPRRKEILLNTGHKRN